MFENKFNTKKVDPLVEAVQKAMQDGDLRRQAEAYVNEAFGVFNRNAVIREELAAYDAALEEAYKCMKEGKPLADKDYDKDGKVESPKDEVWGSRLRAAKMAGKLKEEEQIDEISKELAGRYAKKAHSQSRNATARAVDAYHNNLPKTQAHYSDKSNKREAGMRLAIDKLSGRAKVAATNEGLDVVKRDPSVQGSGDVSRSPKGYEDPSTPKVPYSELPKTQNRAGAVIDSAKGALKEAISKKKDVTKGSVTAPKEFKQERFANQGSVSIAEGVSRKHFQQVADLIKSHDSQEKRNELASHHASIFAKQNPRFDHAKFHAAAGSTAHQQKKIDEKTYSFRAARAGKDIGEKGKMFSKIAKKAGARYGSEERGKKVAGAILAKIRSKHMKEDSSNEG